MIAFLAWYLAFLPFSFALPLVDGADLPLARLVSVLAILLWTAFSLVRARFVWSINFPAFCLSAFFLVASLSFLWAENQAWAVRKILFLWSFFPLFFVFAAELAQDTRRRMLPFLLSGGLGAALVGLGVFLAQFFWGVGVVFHFWLSRVLPFFLGGNFGEVVAAYPSLLVNLAGVTVLRVSAFFPDPHIMAFYMGLLAPLSFALAFSSHGKNRWRWGAGGLALLLADLLTFSRGGYAGLLLALLGVLGFALPLFRFFLRKLIPGALLVVAVFLVLVFSPVGDRFVSSFSEKDASAHERLRLWGEAGEYILENPFLGAGLGNYALAVRPSAAFREPIYAHNLFLDIAVETGLLGLLFFGSFLVSILLRLGRIWREMREPLALALLASFLVFLGHALFETPLFSVHVLPLLLFLSALAITLPSKNHPAL